MLIVNHLNKFLHMSNSLIYFYSMFIFYYITVPNIFKNDCKFSAINSNKIQYSKNKILLVYSKYFAELILSIKQFIYNR